MNSMVFHKSVYTARSTGYKYRTLATNTGEKKRRDELEDIIFDTRFQDLKEMITSKIDQQLEVTRRSRQQLLDKMMKVDAKIDQMLEFQETVKSLRKDLTAAENTLADLLDRVEKLDIFSESSNSTLLYLPSSGNFKDSRDVLQQRGGYSQILYGDYYTNNLM
ncbi:hypothetical protein NE865_10158 [Phthorimaea operculella]|nr:hypothetical protein NE865_10158 [Phthorimaea operculella]